MLFDSRWSKCHFRTRDAQPPVPAPSAGSEMVFPSNGDAPANTSVAFAFTGANVIPGFPATYVWRVKYRQQSGFYTLFFHARIDGELPHSHSFYGCHPYPGAASSGGTQHWWETSIEGVDPPFPEVVDDNGNSIVVVKDQWFKQAMTIEAIAGNECRTRFYWDLDTGTNRVITFETVDDFALKFPTAGGGVLPGLIVGDAPWQPGLERMSASLAQFKMFTRVAGASGEIMTTADILAEAANMNAMVTAAGIAGRWWFKPGFTSVDDLTDPVTGVTAAWVNANKATLGAAL